jgi:CheY-like chemotaxis protein
MAGLRRYARGSPGALLTPWQQGTESRAMNTTEAARTLAGSQPSTEPRSKRILLVEDDPHVAETLAELLELEGYRVTVRHDALTGLEHVRQAPADLVLCDLTLPGEMDGFGFARACRADSALRGLHLLAVSGYDQPEDCRRARASGFDGLVGKPVDVAAIHAALGRGRQAA